MRYSNYIKKNIKCPESKNMASQIYFRKDKNMKDLLIEELVKKTHEDKINWNVSIYRYKPIEIYIYEDIKISVYDNTKKQIKYDVHIDWDLIEFDENKVLKLVDAIHYAEKRSNKVFFSQIRQKCEDKTIEPPIVYNNDKEDLHFRFTLDSEQELIIKKDKVYLGSCILLFYEQDLEDLYEYLKNRAFDKELDAIENLFKKVKEL